MKKVSKMIWHTEQIVQRDLENKILPELCCDKSLNVTIRTRLLLSSAAKETHCIGKLCHMFCLWETFFKKKTVAEIKFMPSFSKVQLRFIKYLVFK